MVAACTDAPAPSAASYCVENDVTITQGVYGLVTYTPDTGLNPQPQPQPQPSYVVHVLDMPNGVEVASATTQHAGVFQATLPVGSYAICFGTDNCVSFSIAENALVRADLASCFCENAWLLVRPSTCAR